MKKVVYSEGINDVYFLQNVHVRCGLGDNFQIFLSEENDGSQTKALRQFKVDQSCEALYKSEGGIDSLLKKFRAHSLAYDVFSLFLLVDLDGSPVSEFFDDMNRCLFSEYKNRVELVQDSKYSMHHMAICDSTLKIDGHNNRNVPVIAFYEDLEKVTGIKDFERREVKERKINAYLDNNPTVVEEIGDIIG